jgi:hexaprenyl-diphosphate synthase
MGELIQRKFEQPGDVELVRYSIILHLVMFDLPSCSQARDYVLRSSGVQRTRALAQAYADKANEVLQELPESQAKVGLQMLTERVMKRKS